MPLDELSREGSFLYSEDFRVGMNLFARGALMAAEMDDRIRAQTDGKKSLRDALRHLMDWSEQNQRAFRTGELPAIFREATGVNTADILFICGGAFVGLERIIQRRLGRNVMGFRAVEENSRLRSIDRRTHWGRQLDTGDGLLRT